MPRYQRSNPHAITVSKGCWETIEKLLDFAHGDEEMSILARSVLVHARRRNPLYSKQCKTKSLAAINARRAQVGRLRSLHKLCTGGYVYVRLTYTNMERVSAAILNDLRRIMGNKEEHSEHTDAMPEGTVFFVRAKIGSTFQRGETDLVNTVFYTDEGKPYYRDSVALDQLYSIYELHTEVLPVSYSTLQNTSELGFGFNVSVDCQPDWMEVQREKRRYLSEKDTRA